MVGADLVEDGAGKEWEAPPYGSTHPGAIAVDIHDLRGSSSAVMISDKFNVV